MSAERTLDVVIPTRDRPDRLADTLRALAAQTRADFGVIVVDDGGVVCAEREPPLGLSVTFLRNAASMGPGLSRNRGAAASGAQYLVFLDDDCVADPELIARHLSALSSGGPVVSLGPILAQPGRRLSAWTHWDADRLGREYSRIASGEHPADWSHFYTGNAGVRRSDFLAVGGFDGRFARQEDVELGYRLARLGCRFAFDAAASVVHDSDRSLRSWTRIPAATANFDALMDRLDPDSGRLAAIGAARAGQHRALRAARPLAAVAPVRRCAVAAATAAGVALHAGRADRLALAAFSVVWDLTYTAALADALGAQPPVEAVP